jgi:NAD(P)H-binding
VRSEKSAKQLRHDIPQTGLAQIIVCDITSLSSGSVNSAAAAAAPAPILDDFAFGLLGGCKAMIVCTSAVPVLVKRSLFQALVLVPWNVMRGKTNATILDTLRFRWKDGQTPEQVDYYGQKAQIDVFARQLGMERVVLLSSMGVCDPHHALNKIGKNPVDGSGHGDILLWKRKAEQYLMAQSSQSQADRRLDYVIVHPGGLTDGPGGQDEIVLDVNDRLIERQKQQQQQQGGDDSVGRVVVKRSIHRADVAALCVAALTEGKNYAFDCVAAAGASSSSSSFDHKKEGIVSSTYAATILSAREALRSFVKYQQAEQKTSRQQNKKPPTRALSYSSSP